MINSHLKIVRNTIIGILALIILLKLITLVVGKAYRMGICSVHPSTCDTILDDMIPGVVGHTGRVAPCVEQDGIKTYKGRPLRYYESCKMKAPSNADLGVKQRPVFMEELQIPPRAVL